MNPWTEKILKIINIDQNSQISVALEPKKLIKIILFLGKFNLGFNLEYFITIYSDVPLTRTAIVQQHAFQYSKSSILNLYAYGAPSYAVSPCEPSSHGVTCSHH